MGSRTSVASEPHGPLARAVHDMRGPLTVIRGLCDMLERGESSDDRRRRLRAIDAEALRLSDALEGLLTPGTGRRGHVDLADLAEACVRRHRWAAEERGVRLTLGVRGRPAVDGDHGAIVRAVDNLVANALRHCAPRGAVGVTVSARGRWAHLCVRDDGAGVPHGDRDAIFTAGCRGSVPRGAGHGLGLAIVRDVAAQHGGRILLDRVESGASFRLVLPRAEDHRRPGAA